jgi:VIT1/CCC1 family predicted Fe2+/Mn2+ transporter
MKHSLKVGFSFGLTSGVITTLGLIVGLHSSTRSKLVIIGGILVIAIADALSDAMGVHVSEESENRHSTREIWESTIATFSSKLVFALSFIAPILLFRLPVAVVMCVIWGISLLTVFSLYLARRQRVEPHKVILEHLCIAVLVIIVTHWVGNWVASFTR